MSRTTSRSTASTATQPSIHPSILRAGLALAILTALSAFAVRAGAQVPATRSLELRQLASTASLLPSSGVRAPSAAALGASGITLAPVPFAVGEELTYKATFGGIPAGTARMRVDGIELVRGRPAYHIVFAIDGGVPFFRVHDKYESWIDVQTLASLRYKQVISEGGYKRNTVFEIYPDRALYQRDAEPMEASVAHPLDEGSFIYAARMQRIRVGETRRDDRHFRPEANPVVLTGLRQDTVSVNAGTFATTVVRPTIKTKGLFSENGDAQIWFSDDASRIPVQVTTKFSKFSLTLSLQSVTMGDASSHQRLLADALAGR